MQFHFIRISPTVGFCSFVEVYLFSTGLRSEDEAMIFRS